MNRLLWVWRATSLIVAAVGLVVLLNSVGMGLEKADDFAAAKQNSGIIVNSVEYGVVRSGHILTFAAIGGILLAVGLFQGLRPFSREEQEAWTANSHRREQELPRIDKASRVIQASPQTVYEAFLNPEVLVSWLPPDGMKAVVHTFDVREGGVYRMSLIYMDAEHAGAGKTSADTDVVQGRFVELVPGRKIVQTAVFESDDPKFAGEMRMTWQLTEMGGITRVTVLCEQVPEGILQKDHQRALASTLGNLAKAVESDR
ncbi:SRPBCC family protein [Saccharibacillus sp. CPCC 101409]|uniref:SRPBCC family protein n=1 Tax=Saccharibacillus sp. CPCC 101409 TaxID=3058041 RepID=UPI00267400ED|nr:SRPBCC family protein [Saccharibacillus sp. CPCC 101409]MDO3410537.1 SRPBCC family protein [Saccharibacillus sp. CPCC 101409]